MNIVYFFTILFFQSTVSISDQKYVLHTPYILADKITQQVEDLLASTSNRDATTLFETLGKKFRWIKTITYKRIGTDRTSVRIDLAEPFCALNATHYVASDGSLFDHDILREDVFEKLPVITYSGSSECSLQIGKQIATLGRNLFDTYTITWYDSNTIILIDKQTECFPIITSLEKKITSQIAHYCHYIHKKIIETYTKKKKKKYALDVRFDKQIILRPQEDIKYEKSFSS